MKFRNRLAEILLFGGITLTLAVETSITSKRSNLVPTATIRVGLSTTVAVPTTSSIPVTNFNSTSPPISNSSSIVPLNTNPSVPAGYQIPSAFDSIIGVNFTSTACPSVLLTMLADPIFQSCTPFSYLLSTSTGFFEAQSSPNLLNYILDRSCNANITVCATYFTNLANQIISPRNCGIDLGQKNAIASQMIIGARNYEIMKEASCLRNPSTNEYCFTEAAQSINPSESYFYQLPFGTPLPTTKINCSSCTAKLMGLFSKYQNNPSLLISLTYSTARAATIIPCGQSYAPPPIQTVNSSSTISLRIPFIYIFVSSILLLFLII